MFKVFFGNGELVWKTSLLKLFLYHCNVLNYLNYSLWECYYNSLSLNIYLWGKFSCWCRQIFRNVVAHSVQVKFRSYCKMWKKPVVMFFSWYLFILYYFWFLVEKARPCYLLEIYLVFFSMQGTKWESYTGQSCYILGCSTFAKTDWNKCSFSY